MSDSKTFVLETFNRFGATQAQQVQADSPNMSGTELNAISDYIPDFQAAKAKQNMLTRPAGQENGFVCRSTAGRVVRLLQVYDSDVYTQEPEDLPAQWRFVWSQDPDKALPFIALSTSPYATGDCCTEGGHVYRSTIDNNVWATSAYPQGWADLGPIGSTTEPETTPEEPEPTPEPDEPQGGATYPAWVQPTGGHDAYQTGDIVDYNGTLYQSTIDGNVWAPDAYPAGWKVYEGA